MDLLKDFLKYTIFIFFKPKRFFKKELPFLEWQNIIYKSKLKNDGTIDDVNSISQPVVVPYSKDPSNPRYYKLHIALYGDGIANDDNIMRTKIKYKYKGKFIDIPQTYTGREFDIKLPAPDFVGFSYLTLNFDFERNYGDGPIEMWTSVSAKPQEIKIPIYTILDFSKRLDEGIPEGAPTLPSKNLIAQALDYNNGAKLAMDSIENIVKGVYNDRKHKYITGTQYYLAGQFNACDLAEFKYGKYFSDKQNRQVKIDCATTSYLISSLLRSIGVEIGIYGFKQGILKYETKEIKVMGDNSWKNYFFDWHQFNILGNIFDGIMRYKEGNKASYVLNLPLEDYKSKIFKDISFNDEYCSLTNTGLGKINY